MIDLFTEGVCVLLKYSSQGCVLPTEGQIFTESACLLPRDTCSPRVHASYRQTADKHLFTKSACVIQRDYLLAESVCILQMNHCCPTDDQPVNIGCVHTVEGPLVHQGCMTPIEGFLLTKGACIPQRTHPSTECA